MNDQPGPDDREPREPIGSVADEAAKLLGALSGWAQTQGEGLGQGFAQAAESAQEAMHSIDDHIATGSAECTWCPVCRAVHAVRELSPEVRTHLASATASMAQAIAAAMATFTPEPQSRREPHVERIDLDDAEPGESGPGESEPGDPGPGHADPDTPAGS